MPRCLVSNSLQCKKSIGFPVPGQRWSARYQIQDTRVSRTDQRIERRLADNRFTDPSLAQWTIPVTLSSSRGITE